MVKAENPLKEGLGEGAIRGLDRWHGQNSPESEVTEWTRGCRRRTESQEDKWFHYQCAKDSMA